jgi:protein-S-isoprenylcysteine O-methyltransferase Ste14
MKVIAVHSFGFFNLWILMVLYSLPILLTLIFHKHIFQPTSSRFSSSRSSREYNIFILSKIIMLVYFLYAIVIPIHLDTPIAITGLIVYVIGFVFYSAAWITVSISGGGKVVSNGPFRFSRHPIYLSSAFLFVGAGFISKSYLYLVLSLVVGFTHMRNAIAEEQICLEAYGDEYRGYMAGTPRWLGRSAPKPNDTHGSPRL